MKATGNGTAGEARCLPGGTGGRPRGGMDAAVCGAGRNLARGRTGPSGYHGLPRATARRSKDRAWMPTRGSDNHVFCCTATQVRPQEPRCNRTTGYRGHGLLVRCPHYPTSRLRERRWTPSRPPAQDTESVRTAVSVGGRGRNTPNPPTPAAFGGGWRGGEPPPEREATNVNWRKRPPAKERNTPGPMRPDMRKPVTPRSAVVPFRRTGAWQRASVAYRPDWAVLQRAENVQLRLQR